MTVRTPPHDLTAEANALGAMLLSRTAIADVCDLIDSNDYYRPAHGHIHTAVVALDTRGDPVDLTTVAAQLTTMGVLDQAGGTAALLEIQNRTPASSNAGKYARIVADHSIMRRLVGVAGEIAELGYTPTDDVPAVIDRAEAFLYAVTGRRNERNTVLLGDTLGDFIDRTEARFNGDGPAGTPTGLIDLDTILLGLHPGQLITVAARPAMGKSAFAAEIASTVATAAPVLFVSAEMSVDELVDRYVANASVVDLQSIRSGKLSQNDWDRITSGVTRLRDLPVWLEPDAGATLMSIRGAARRLNRHTPLGLVVVDYMQLLTASTKPENRQVEIAELSRGLKRMALEMNVPVMALSQLNRNVEHRGDKRPMLADLRESGAIEQDSDVVLFLYRDEMYNPDSEDHGICEVIVAKQRNGPTGTVRTTFDGRYGRFRNMARAA